MMLAGKVGIFGVLVSYMMLLFGGILLLDRSGRSDIRQRCVGMSRQPLVMTSPFYDMYAPVP